MFQKSALREYDKQYLFLLNFDYYSLSLYLPIRWFCILLLINEMCEILFANSVSNTFLPSEQSQNCTFSSMCLRNLLFSFFLLFFLFMFYGFIHAFTEFQSMGPVPLF